ncbi:hypothetical protein RCH18_000337 [Flavobacterium sp. PL11]|uniref:hypothetical protein n=1 Tax=Flavobacterium sp. PL11 TaxID=3071717 RepID=UPI002DFB18DD|nr:hypothetical protein [Flavobacterium sp. PL11]
METVTQLIIKIFIETLFISGFLGYLFTKREERMKKTIEEEFAKRATFFDARFNFKLRSLEELLAPIRLQLIRSKLTLLKYDANNEYREKILKECNETILGLLLEKGFLLPIELIPHAEEFIKHYDNWLQEYKKKRIDNNDKKTSLVFTFDFPEEAEIAFKEKFNTYRKELEIEGSLN